MTSFLEEKYHKIRDDVYRKTDHKIIEFSRVIDEKKSLYEFKFICGNCSQVSVASISKISEKQTCIHCSIRKKIFEKTGHHIIRWVKTNGRSHGTYEYKCGQCGKISQSNDSNLMKTKNCKHCANAKQRNDYEKVKKEFVSRGYEFLYTESQFKLEYKGNKQKLNVRCPLCKKEITRSLSETKRGRLCPNKNCFQKRKEKTCVEKYGVDNPFKSKEIQEKISKTHMKNLGVSYPTQNKDVMKRQIETNLKNSGYRHNFENPKIRILGEQKLVEIYGTKYPLTLSAIQEKCRTTCQKKYGKPYFLMTQHTLKYMSEHCDSEEQLKKDYFTVVMLQTYGVRYPMQDPEIFEKTRAKMFSKKKFTFPESKIVVFVQGYEGYAIDNILKTPLKCLGGRISKEEDVQVGINVPHFRYIFQNIEHTYFPDIYIQGTRVIIEIKSFYTFNLAPEKNYEKFKNVADSGFLLYLAVLDKGKVKDICYFFPGKYHGIIISKRGYDYSKKVTEDKKRKATFNFIQKSKQIFGDKEYVDYLNSM